MQSISDIIKMGFANDFDCTPIPCFIESKESMYILSIGFSIYAKSDLTAVIALNPSIRVMCSNPMLSSAIKTRFSEDERKRNFL